MTRNDAGFTLIETLVAVMVFALAGAALQQSLAGGWRGVRLVRTQDAALRIAKSEIAAAGSQGDLVEGTVEGITQDGFAWSRAIRRRGGGQPGDLSPTGIDGYWVDVTVRWKEAPLRPERSIQLSTLKLRNAP